MNSVAQTVTRKKIETSENCENHQMLGQAIRKKIENAVGGLTRASDNGFLITDGGMAERLKATVC